MAVAIRRDKYKGSTEKGVIIPVCDCWVWLHGVGPGDGLCSSNRSLLGRERRKDLTGRDNGRSKDMLA